MKEFSRMDLIDLGLVFVEGAVYKDNDGNLYRIAHTAPVGTFTCDAYLINKEGERLNNWADPINESDLECFIEDMSF